MFAPHSGLRKLLVCFSIALVSATTVQAQAPVAEFSATPTTGFVPMAVSFTDLSTGSVTGWVWSFGDTNGSLLQNPLHTYLAPGTYSVTLTASGPGGSDPETKVDYIVAIGPTNADFVGSPLNGTAPLSVSFTDTTSPPASAWAWDFGDGNSSTAQNPTHTYAAVGDYTVSLTATSVGGPDLETKTDYISATQSALASYRNGGTFINPAAYSAAAPVVGQLWTAEVDSTAFPGTIATIIYGRMTPIAGVSTMFGRLLINIGSGILFDSVKLSSGGIDTHSFPLPNDPGLIGLTGYTQAFCFVNASTGQFLNAVDLIAGTAPVVARPTASFTAASTTGGPAPLSVAFIDNSTGPITAWTWDFGDGTASTSANPSHTYTTGGTFSVSLVVEGPGGFDLEFRGDYIVVVDPVPDFMGTPLTGLSPLSVAFMDLTSGSVTAWSWDFGDGGSSSLQNPTHSYALEGTYTVSLTSTGPGGANTETKADFITVMPGPPVTDFIGTPTAGATPLNVTFTDLSVGTITAWAWDFGDLGTSSLQNPTNIYIGVGTYTVSLTTTGPGGVGSDTKTDYVVVTPPVPVPDFAGAPLSGTEPLLVTFTDATTGIVSGWSWSFGDLGTSTLQNPTHTYAAAGTYTVSLTATGPGGMLTETKTDYVMVAFAPPVADFTGFPTLGNAPMNVAFSDASVGSVSSWSWDFGDAGSSTMQNPTHTYALAGTYTVTLNVTGPGGIDGESKLGYVVVLPPAPVADFAGTPLSGNEPLGVTFTDLSSGMISDWSWDFGDLGSSTLQSPTHLYATAGTYTVVLTATGPGGVDSETKTDYVVVLPPAPVASFGGTPLTGNEPLVVNFSDTSSGPISVWSWDFGDLGTSTLQNPSHSYAAGTYTVSMTVTGPGGMDAATIVDYITVLPPAPLADFAGMPTTGTEPLTVTFTDATSNTVTSWSWSFGDGGVATVQNPSYTYVAPGTYAVSLTSTGPGGLDTITKSDYVTVSFAAPVAALSGTPLSGNEPLTVNFSDDSTNTVTAWAWTFGDGGVSALENPSHTYLAAGTFTVGLTATGPGGSDLVTVTDYVTVLPPSPVAEFAGSPLAGVVPLVVTFTDMTTNTVTAWSWDFGDGGSSTIQNPSYSYLAAGTYTVSLTATGPGGSDLETKADYVVATPFVPTAQFVGSPTTGIEPLTVNFTDQSTGVVTGWLWNFGDASTSTLQNPSKTYAFVGTYTVTLTAMGPGGNDIEVKADYVTVSDAAPSAAFAGSPLNGNQPLVVNFTDQSLGIVTAWMWTFGDGGSSTVQNPSYTYVLFGTYTVSLTASGPGGTDTHVETGYVTVLPPPPVADFVGSPTAGSAPLNVAFTDLSSGLVSSWNWDFGDVNFSSIQNPTHTYSFPGTYTVSLTASGAGGPATETKPSYVIVTPGALLDGSFELQSPGNAPSSPWPAIGGSSHVVLPDTAVVLDNGMPAHGSNWLGLSADGSNAATPPSNPGGAGLAPVGASGVAQSFFFDPLGPALVFSAAFILNDDLASVATNDFMSVDISDGLATHNLYYADSFSAFPNASNRYGLPMTDVDQVGTNLALLYPSATAGTLLTLTVQVGNGGDGLDSSLGYFDRVVDRNLSSLTWRNGNEINPWCYVASPPVLGQTWEAFIDHRDRPAATVVLLLVRGSPSIPINSGFGEVLVGLPTIFDVPLSAHPSGITTFASPLPADLSMMGMAASQGLILGVPDQTFCNAIDLSIGFELPDPIPAADFSASTTLGPAPLSVSFSDTSIGTITSWEWDFGDGSSSTVQNPSHTYNAVATYSVGLRVQGPGGLDVERKFDHIQAQ